LTTYKFGKSTRKLLVESNRETFIGYVLGATISQFLFRT